MSKFFRIFCTGDSTSYGSTVVTWFYTANGYPAGSDFFYPEARFTDPPGNPRQAAKFVNPDGHLCMNLAWAGWRQADLTKQLNGTDSYFSLSALLGPDYVAGGGRPEIVNIVAVRIGTNNETGVVATDAEATRQYCLALQALGAHVILCPIWSKTNAAWDNAFTIPMNNTFATWGAGDGIAAFVPATNALLYGANACANGTYFNADKIHLVQAGYDIAAAEYLAVQDALIASLN